MAVPRSLIVDENCSGIYHCISRCVRQAFLLESADDHRRNLVVTMARRLCTAFAIDVVSFAVMENHLHLVLRTLPELAAGWSDREIAYRWLLVRPRRRQRELLGIDPDAPPQSSEIDQLCASAARIATLRKRLSSLSWFMKELKEPLARIINAEEGRDGRFWQDRFRCRRLLGDASVLCCATYVDMNPVAAGVVENPLAAPFTSVNEHLERLACLGGVRSGVLGADSRMHENQGHQEDQAATTAGGVSPGTVDQVGGGQEALLRRLDEVVFQAAIPCRRSPHVLPHVAGSDRDGSCAPCASDGDQESRAVTEEAAARSPVDEDASPPATRVLGDPEEGHEEERGCSPAPQSGAGMPPVQILGMTLGQYFRRLLVLSELLIDRSGAIADDDLERGSPPDLRAALDTGTLSNDALATFIRGPLYRGNAIGSKTDLTLEAARRGKHRVICALR